MRVLVTGATGFIGSHLTELLINEGMSVRAFVHYNSQGNLGWLEDIQNSDALEITKGDIRDFDIVSAAVEGVDIVFHLAALVGIPYSYASPEAYLHTNVSGSFNVLQASREHRVQRLVHTSTSEIYGTAQYVPIDELHPVNPQSPYAASKASADHFAVAFYRAFDIPVTIVRPFNTYGPRQSPRAVIPTIITQLSSGAEQIKLGSLHPTRDLSYVTDTVKGFLAAALSNDAIGETINLGTGIDISIKDLAKRICQLMNVDATVMLDKERVRPEKSEVDRLLCDVSKASRLIGWSPLTSLESGLEMTIRWFSQRLAGEHTDEYSV